jgi:hypothetical protein
MRTGGDTPSLTDAAAPVASAHAAMTNLVLIEKKEEEEVQWCLNVV